MKPKILLCDIETLPLEVWAWGLFDQNIGLNQIKSDWTLLSWSAKWIGEKKIYYDDVRNDPQREDKRCLGTLWKLLDQADVVCWHYGSSFDHKKLNARFVLNGYKPPAKYRQIDTKKMASKNFGFTSNKLEYLADKLSEKNKKLVNRKFSGFDLWKECMKGNRAAFREMERYNKADILALEDVLAMLRPWGTGIDMQAFNEDHEVCEACGCESLIKYGFAYTNKRRYQRLKCTSCGASSRGAKPLSPGGKNAKKI